MIIDRAKRYRLSRDVKVRFRDFYDVTAPKGTPLQLVKNGSGTTGDLLAIPPHLCDAGGMGEAGTPSIFGHDSTYFYIFAPLDAVEEF